MNKATNTPTITEFCETNRRWFSRHIWRTAILAGIILATFLQISRAEDQLLGWGYNDYGQATVPSLPSGVTFTDAAGGIRYFSLGVTSQGQGVGWGWNGYGNLNFPALPAGVTYTKVAAGYYHTMALRSDGQVVAFGYNSGSGELTVPGLPAGKIYTDIAAGYVWGMAIRSDGQIVAWGNNSWGNLNVPALLAGSIYTKVFAGQIHALAIKHDYVSVTLNGAAEINILLGGSFTDPGATAQDDLGNSLAVTTTGAVNVNAVGSYLITYTATDSGGQVGSAVRTVNIVKKLPSDLWVAAMPSYTRSLTYANAVLNEPIMVWGRAWNGTPPYSYDLDYGDGSSHLTGSGVSAAAATFIGANHTYSSSGSKTITLSVSDSAGHTYSREAVIRVLLSPTHDDRINMAIEKGLIYLYRNQTTLDANRIYWNVYGWNHQ